MRVASITMIGQFPDCIDLHVRNLKWALTKDDHIFIVTLPEFIERFKLANDDRVTFVPFERSDEEFINFWGSFPAIVEKYSIKPEWFLFMEEDIWFFAKPVIQDYDKMIRSFLPLGSYRNVMLNGNIFHERVWEGSHLVHGDIVRRAIDFGVNFSFVRETFLDKNRGKYESELGGVISMSMYNHPDTMDEFGLYCALVEKTRIEPVVKALHLRGPESLHRKFPDIYHFASSDRLKEIQKKMPYIDILLAVAAYYTVGNWEEIHHLDWTKAHTESKREITRLLLTGSEWMNFHEYTRLDSLQLLMNGMI